MSEGIQAGGAPEGAPDDAHGRGRDRRPRARHPTHLPRVRQVFPETLTATEAYAHTYG